MCVEHGGNEMNPLESIVDELLYHGKKMNPQPVNTSFYLIVAALRQGDPVVAKLEPGDGTHYALLIVPAWADGVASHLGRYGIRPSTSASYLIVTQLNDHGGDSFYAFSEGTETWDMQSIKNEWTREVFAWWFRILWSAIKKENT
jgi:hypothetical protein